MGAYGVYGGYSDFSGYPGYNGMLGNTTMTQAYSNMPVSSDNVKASNVDNILNGVSEAYNKGLQPPKKKGFFDHFKDFFKGIANGFVKLVKSLADPKTWLMIAAMVALCVLVPGAGTALMMLGIGMAGMQIFKGISSGNAEQVGEGTFNLGLAFVGGKSSGTAVKAAEKGKEAALYSRAGTRVADAEKALAKAKEGKDKNKIADAEKALDAARESQARSHLHTMSKSQRDAHLQKPNIKTVDDFNAAIKQNSETLATKQGDLLKARESLNDIKKNTPDNAAAIKQAEADVKNAEEAITTARKDLNDLYIAQRIKVKENEKLTLGKRVKGYLSSTKNSTQDHMAGFFGKPLTSADGKTISYWSRTPKASNLDEAATTAEKTKSSFSWLKNPFRGFGKNSEKAEAATKNAKEAAQKADDAAVLADDTAALAKDAGKLSADALKLVEDAVKLTDDAARRMADAARKAAEAAQKPSSTNQAKAAADAAERANKAKLMADAAKKAADEKLAAEAAKQADEARLAAEAAKKAADEKPVVEELPQPNTTKLTTNAEKAEEVTITEGMPQPTQPSGAKDAIQLEVKNGEVVPVDSTPLPPKDGILDRTKTGIREHGFSSFIYANSVGGFMNPLLVQVGLPEHGLIG